MKKHGLKKKLALNKETLAYLEELRPVVGAGTATCASCITCPRTNCDCGTNGGSSGHLGCDTACF